MLALALALASLSPPAPGPDLTGFAALPEDPPPKEIVRGLHYWVSNEERPELFREDMEKLSGGVYIGVGAEQNFVFAGWSKPDVMVLMDFDSAIPDLHRIFATVFKRSATRKEFVEAWKLENLKILVDAVKADYPDAAVQARLLDVIKEARANVRVHCERLQKGFTERKVPTYLNDDDKYAFIRQLFVDGRVFIVRGDLTADKTMQAIGEASKRAGLSVHTLYLSNAEQYFSYDAGFRRNILGLPFDEKGIVARTMSWARFGFAKDSNSYHYDVQSGLGMQSWVADDKTTGVATILDAAPRKNGFSRMLTPPASPVAAATIDNAPPPIPCPEAKREGMACIPGGPFLRGINSKKKLDANANPQSTIWVQSFLMDENEVTYAEYKACEADKRCKKAGPNYSDFNAPKQPITGVTWYDAKTYCEAHGKRLPTESEWEKAARGTDGRMYPWGNEPATCDRTVIMIDAGRSCGKKQASKDHPDTGRPEPVGSKPPTLYGLYDMAGNSWEWVADWASESYAACGDACAGVDPKGPCGGAEPCAGHTERVVRGGSWYWPAQYATTYYRRTHTPSNSPLFHHFGFRCAADVAK